MTKADYVRAQGQNRDHHCHWTGCTKQVPPAMWGCKAHWFKLPPDLRRRIWRCYAPGQEITGRPSAEYVAVAREAQAWIASQPKEHAAPGLFDRPSLDAVAREHLMSTRESVREESEFRRLHLNLTPWPPEDETSPWTHGDGRDD